MRYAAQSNSSSFSSGSRVGVAGTKVALRGEWERVRRKERVPK